MSVCRSRERLHAQESADTIEAFNLDCTGQRCYFCWKVIGNPDTDPAVSWHAGMDLFFHAQCARSLGQHLIKDGIVAEEERDRRRPTPPAPAPASRSS